jgi:hypothetical protein
MSLSKIEILEQSNYVEYQRWYESIVGIPLPDTMTQKTFHTDRYKCAEVDVALRLDSRKLLNISPEKAPITIQEICNYKGLIQTEKIKIEDQANLLIILCLGTLTVAQSLKDYVHLFRRRKPITQFKGFKDPYNMVSIKLENPKTQIYITGINERKESFLSQPTFYWFYSGY